MARRGDTRGQDDWKYNSPDTRVWLDRYPSCWSRAWGMPRYDLYPWSGFRW